MATQQFTETQAAEVEPRDCPDCGGEIVYDDLALQCAECGYAPRHAAD